MKKIIQFIVLSIILAACARDENECCVNYDTAISVKYLNENGENLFEIENGYNESDITIYHKIDGDWEKYYEGNLDYPKGIRLIEFEDETYLNISPSITIIENNYSETKIEFSESDFDIIKTEIEKNNSFTVVNKVWFNDILKWEAYETERLFEIIKQN